MATWLVLVTVLLECLGELISQPLVDMFGWAPRLVARQTEADPVAEAVDKLCRVCFQLKQTSLLCIESIVPFCAAFSNGVTFCLPCLSLSLSNRNVSFKLHPRVSANPRVNTTDLQPTDRWQRQGPCDKATKQQRNECRDGAPPHACQACALSDRYPKVLYMPDQ